MPQGKYSDKDLEQKQGAYTDKDVVLSYPAKPSLWQQAKESGRQIAGEFGDLGLGLAKSAASTVYGGAKMIGIPLPDMSQYTEPKGAYQNVGKVIGDTAQFFLPGAGATATTAKIASKVPALAGPSAKLATKAAIEGAGMGALSKAQGSSNTGAAVNTAIGAASPYAGIVARAIAEKWPAAIVNNMLRPFAKQFRFGKNPGQAVVDEGIVARSMNSLLEQVSAAKKDVGKEIGQVLGRPKPLKTKTGAYMMPPPDPGNIPQIVTKEHPSFNELELAKNRGIIDSLNQANKIVPQEQVGAIDDAIAEAVRGGPTNQPIVDQLLLFKKSILNESKLNPAGQIEFSGPRGPMTPAEAQNLKHSIGENTRWTGEAYDKPLNLAKSKTYGKLASDVEAKVPEVEDLSRRYSNLMEAEKIAERRANANPNIRMSEISAGLIGEDLMPHAGIPAALTVFGLRTAPGATILAQGIKRGTVPAGRTLKDLVAAFVSRNIGRNSQQIGR